ncbi:group III truncated hemoglobin [Methylopila musalis]|uniref:Group III truncated hemoglobin n=1 Tax=Methylopila musalis TaxID=1134781 RepID=A0ABW3Z4L8_9HYPH
MTPPTHDDLRALVHDFYAAVRADAELGPLFEGVVADWPEHLERLTDFWSSVLLGSGRYKGDPFGAHVAIRDRIRPELFARWLALWGAATERRFPPPVAAALQARAARIAASLQAGLFFRPDGPDRSAA